MVVDEETVILIILCIGAFKGLCYGIRVSQTHPPTIIQTPTNSLKQITNLSPTNDSFKDLETNFLPVCKIGAKKVPMLAKSDTNHTKHALTYFGRTATTILRRLNPQEVGTDCYRISHV